MYWHSSSNSIQGNIFLFWRFWQRYSPIILPACLWILCLSFNSSQRAVAPDITLFFTKKFSLSSISLSSASVKKLNSHPNSWTILLVLVCFSSTKFPEQQIVIRKKNLDYLMFIVKCTSETDFQWWQFNKWINKRWSELNVHILLHYVQVRKSVNLILTTLVVALDLTKTISIDFQYNTPFW